MISEYSRFNKCQNIHLTSGWTRSSCWESKPALEQGTVGSTLEEDESQEFHYEVGTFRSSVSEER